MAGSETMTKKNNFDLLEISGNPFEKGKEYGELKKDSIEILVKYVYKTFLEDKTSKDKVLEYIKKHIPYIKEYSNDIYDELRGIAKGSNKLLEEIVMIHMQEETSGFTSHNCTTFASTGKATVNGETFIGQTWDISKNLCENAGAFLLKDKANKGPEILAYTYAGMLAGAGMNSKGISLVWNSVPRLKIKVGVPTYIIIAEILRQDKIGDALAAIFRAKRSGCFNFLIADTSEIYNIEVTPDDVHISYSDTFLTHANHFLSDKFKNMQDIAKVASKYSASTIIRQNRMNRLLKEKYGNIDLENCKNFMYDHVNYPESICRHPDPKKDKEKQIITCSSFVMVPFRKEMWISNGPACENGFQKYNI